jgi:hypothetical protein
MERGRKIKGKCTKGVMRNEDDVNRLLFISSQRKAFPVIGTKDRVETISSFYQIHHYHHHRNHSSVITFDTINILSYIAR